MMRTANKRIFLMTALLAAAVPATYAGECDEAQDQVTMTACAEQSYETSDAELNRLYRQIEQRLGDDGEIKELLIQTDRAWVAFRDNECAFASSAVVGGSAYPMTKAMCFDELTANRIEDLRQYLNCEEGDLGCPVPSAK